MIWLCNSLFSHSSLTCPRFFSATPVNNILSDMSNIQLRYVMWATIFISRTSPLSGQNASKIKQKAWQFICSLISVMYWPDHYGGSCSGFCSGSEYNHSYLCCLPSSFFSYISIWGGGSELHHEDSCRFFSSLHRAQCMMGNTRLFPWWKEVWSQVSLMFRCD